MTKVDLVMVLVDTLWASPTQVHSNACGNQILGVKNVKYKTWKGISAI